MIPQNEQERRSLEFARQRERNTGAGEIAFGVIVGLSGYVMHSQYPGSFPDIIPQFVSSYYALEAVCGTAIVYGALKILLHLPAKELPRNTKRTRPKR